MTSISAIQLQRLQATPGLGDGPQRLAPLPGDRTEGTGFAETLRDAVGKVDGAQRVANEHIEAFIAGESENLHDVMIAMNEAELHFQLMTEVRNRLLETYQDLMRLQV